MLQPGVASAEGRTHANDCRVPQGPPLHLGTLAQSVREGTMLTFTFINQSLTGVAVAS